MNRRGTIYLAVVSGIFIFLFGILFLTFIDNEVLDAQQNSTTLFPNGTSQAPGLACGPADDPNMAISDGNKLTCLATDTVVPYFILLVLSISVGSIIGRFI